MCIIPLSLRLMDENWFCIFMKNNIVDIIIYINQQMNITIIDDEVILAKNISKKLEKHGFSVEIFNNCTDFYQFQNAQSDLYIVDIWLTDGTGFEIIQWLRNTKQSSAYIIITSAFWDLEKKLYGLDLWADDYMTKPCNPEELLARIKANLRRKPQKQVYTTWIYTYKNIVFNEDKNILTLAGQIINVTKKERLLVKIFLWSPNCLIQKSTIVSKVWQSEDELSVSDNTINVTISNLRKKLWSEFKLKTKINEGYILEL